MNITGLIIQAGQILGYYNESATDTLLDTKANQVHGHTLGVSNVSGLQGILNDKSNTTHQHAISDSNITAGINASKIGSGTVDNTEFGYLDGITSAIQTQINDKFDNSNHTTATHNALNIDADTVDGYHAGNAAGKVPVLDGSGDLPLAQIPDTLTGKDADTVDGKSASDLGIITSGSFTGNGNTNQAITHGLGRTPQYVYMLRMDNIWIIHLLDMDMVRLSPSGGYTTQTNTAWTSTNFYVGPVGNTNGVTYKWVAFG